MGNHDGAAATWSGSLAYRDFPRVNQGVSRFADVGHDQGEVQSSAKSDRILFIVFAPDWRWNPAPPATP